MSLQRAGLTSFWKLNNISVCVCMKWNEVKVTQTYATLWGPHGLYSPWNAPGQNTGMGSCFLLQGIFPTQGLNPGLLHCRWIPYQLSHKGSPRILEWVAFPFLQWIFPTQGSSWGLLHCRWILYQLSYQGIFVYTPYLSAFICQWTTWLLWIMVQSFAHYFISVWSLVYFHF